ncbi:MAG: EAL domain-containing protein, partial [Lachnospiraceae bacterium]|nr:EAL domain-containing protein [Lachnospiraceae bacterium]
TELNINVVAEGVETRTQLEYLKAMNCKVVQGFLFDKAMPKEAYEDKMLFGKYEM